MSAVTISAISWPRGRAAEGVERLARAAGLPLGASANANQHMNQVPSIAAALGLEAEAVDASYDEIGGLLRAAGPAVIRINDGDPNNDDDPNNAAMVMLIGARGRRVRVVSPDHRVTTIPIEMLRRTLVEPAAQPLRVETERLLNESGVAASASVANALVAERLRSQRLQAGWLLRVPASTAFRSQLRAAKVRRTFVLLSAAHAAQYLLWLAAWWLLGRAALQGRLDPGWLSAWTVMLLSVIPLQLAAFWMQGRLAITIGALLKQRLLAGAFRLEPEEIRREGAGHLLGRVIEAEAFESLALGGGFTAVFAALELVIAAAVVALASPHLALLLALWTCVAAVLGVIFFRRRLSWVQHRITLTLELIERMVGHRTRIAQQRPERWHDGEDESVERYVEESASMDRAAVRLVALVPRGWMVVGLAGIAPMFVRGEDGVSLSIALGGVLLAFRGLDRLTQGISSLAGAAIAWRQTAPVFRAASRARVEAAVADLPASSNSISTDGRQPAALEATDIRFRHSGRDQPVLQGCDLTIAPGERVILQGPSGGGKSTLASLLAGLRSPQSGLLMLDGLDRHTLGSDGWRRRVVLVPQFHENHLVLGSLAFNLLMGVSWPPSEADFGRAEGVLRELGLGATLDRMPSGLLQTVGETGWQLSHGERSRVFLARALLQQPDVLILDESFAQLDPENMKLALDAVTSRPSSVLLIAHP
jgi:ATP-binding cassette, subfamily B, bacterial